MTAPKPNGFDVMKAMSAKERDIRLAPIGNVTRVQKTKRGTLVTIGVEGDVIAGLAQGRFLGGLILCDREDWRKTEAELAEGGQ